MLPSFDIHSDKSEFLFVTDLILTMSLRRLSLASGIEKKRIPPSNTCSVCTVRGVSLHVYSEGLYRVMKGLSFGWLVYSKLL